MQSTDDALRDENLKLRAELEGFRRAYTDMEHLVAASEVGILSLDQHLCIKRFTPKLAELFGLAPGDEGRPISSIGHDFDYAELADDALEALRTLKMRERQLRNRNGDWIACIRPYLVDENRVDCIVITLVRLSEGGCAENALAEMTSAFTHEINQPLTAALTYLGVVRRLLTAGTYKGEEIAGILDKASKELLRAGTIIGRLRDGGGREEPDKFT
ncbi:MAG: PAS domain-containing protein [Chloroflexota bacterium]|jgi:two-component system, chemotaxis family, CheB/CheR fusion protein